MSLSALITAVPVITAPTPPAAVARQMSLMVLRSAGLLVGLAVSVPMVQVTRVALVAVQSAFSAETKLAPLGTVSVRTVLVAAWSAELSMPTELGVEGTCRDRVGCGGEARDLWISRPCAGRQQSEKDGEAARPLRHAE